MRTTRRGFLQGAGAAALVGGFGLPGCSSSGERAFGSGDEVMRGVAYAGERLSALTARLMDEQLTPAEQEQVRGLLRWTVDPHAGLPQVEYADAFVDRQFGGGEDVVFTFLDVDMVHDVEAAGDDLEVIHFVQTDDESADVGFVVIHGQPVVRDLEEYDRLAMSAAVGDAAATTVPLGGDRVVAVSRRYFGQAA